MPCGSTGVSLEITVDTQCAPALSNAIVQIRDHGPGVPAEHLERILLPFYRVRASNGQAGGAGLGLAITDHIIRVQGGTVSALTLPTDVWS
jgi:signal transduction histidine kinase